MEYYGLQIFYAGFKEKAFVMKLNQWVKKGEYTAVSDVVVCEALLL